MLSSKRRREIVRHWLLFVWICVDERFCALLSMQGKQNFREIKQAYLIRNHSSVFKFFANKMSYISKNSSSALVDP